MPVERQLFAVLPAAGLSRRMGQPKLMLPLGGKTVIRRLLDVLDSPAITDRIVVLRQGNEPLAAEVAAASATVIVPETPPPDMRSSVEHALTVIRERHTPMAEDGWMLIPADHPLLDVAVLSQLIDTWQASDAAIMLPSCGGHRGHPTFFRWSLADEVPLIPSDKGLNELVRCHAGEVCEIEVDDSAVLIDLDTPDDYESLRERFSD